MNENSDNIHIHKTSEDGKEVDVDINKDIDIIYLYIVEEYRRQGLVLSLLNKL